MGFIEMASVEYSLYVSERPSGMTVPKGYSGGGRVACFFWS